MVPYFNSIDHFLTLPVYSLAIAIGKPKNSASLHCGIIFIEKNKSSFLHFAIHHRLLLDELTTTYEESFDDMIYINFAHLLKHDTRFFIRKSLISLAYAIQEKNRHKLPYAFLFKKSHFDENGNYVLGEGEHGFTCSTFVLAFLERHGISLIRKDTWPNRTEEDAVAHHLLISILTKLKEPGISEHIDIIKKDIGCVRYRPEEVAAASSFTPLPKDYSQIVGRSVEILEELS